MMVTWYEDHHSYILSIISNQNMSCSPETRRYLHRWCVACSYHVQHISNTVVPLLLRTYSCAWLCLLVVVDQRVRHPGRRHLSSVSHPLWIGDLLHGKQITKKWSYEGNVTFVETSNTHLKVLCNGQTVPPLWKYCMLININWYFRNQPLYHIVTDNIYYCNYHHGHWFGRMDYTDYIKMTSHECIDSEERITIFVYRKMTGSWMHWFGRTYYNDYRSNFVPDAERFEWHVAVNPSNHWNYRLEVYELTMRFWGVGSTTNQPNL
jgi:hypothetical protein